MPIGVVAKYLSDPEQCTRPQPYEGWRLLVLQVLGWMLVKMASRGVSWGVVPSRRVPSPLF